MSASQPTPSLPTTAAPPPIPSTAPLALSTAPLGSTGVSTGQSPPPSTGPPPPPSTVPLVYSPAEMTDVLNDLVTAVQGIRLYLAGSYGPPPRPGQPWSAPALAASPTPPGSSPPPSWHPPHPGATATLVGPLQLQPAPATAPIWPQWPTEAIAAPAASVVSRQQLLPLPLPPSTGLTTTAPAGMPIQQVRFPPSPSQLPAWLAGTSAPPVYTMAADQPAPSLPYDGPSSSTGFHAGFDGPPLS
nr:lysine-rich arabinogalactan protein 19-like [Aegilops tauschii subsp. strangulata]